MAKVLDGRRTWLVLIGLLSVSFMSSLEQTVVGTASRTIGDNLNGISQQAWVTTGFLIASTVSVSISSKLSDIFGRRTVLLTAIGIFMLASLCCSLVTDMWQLTGARVLQGLGAGGLMSLPLAIMGDIFSARERPRYQAIFFIVFAVSASLGPLVGGAFAQANQILWIDGWRWVFLINVPVAAAAFGMVFWSLRLPKIYRRTRIDWWGVLLVVTTVAPVLIVTEQGFYWGWGSWMSILGYCVAGLSLILFIFVEWKMGPDAILPLGIFRSRTFGQISILGFLVGFVFFAVLMVLPMFLQVVHHLQPRDAGLLLLVMVVGMTLTSLLSGRIITRRGYIRFYPAIGCICVIAGLVFIVSINYQSSIWFPVATLFFLGLGMGMVMQSLSLMAQSSAPAKFMAVASGSSIFFRQIGGAIGMATVFSMLFGRLPGTIEASLHDPKIQAGVHAALASGATGTGKAGEEVKNLISGNVAGLGEALHADTSFVAGLDHRLAAPFLDGFTHSMVGAYWVALAVAIAAAVIAFTLKRVNLSERPGMQIRMDEDRAEALHEPMAVTGAIQMPIKKPSPTRRKESSP